MEPNSILFDLNKQAARVYNRTSGKMRLYLGESDGSKFDQTVDSIKSLDEEDAKLIKEKIQSFVNHKIKHKTAEEKYLDNLRQWEEKQQQDMALMRTTINYFD